MKIIISIALGVMVIANFTGCSNERKGMVLIPAGEFEMGDHFDEGEEWRGDAGGGIHLIKDERPVHTVYLDAFFIDKYEVTNAQYAKFLNTGVWTVSTTLDTQNARAGGLRAAVTLIEKVGNTYKPKTGYENHPVNIFSWHDAAAYAQWVGKRLPTEAQWEKAARGGLVGKRYPWGDNISHNNANYSGTGGIDKWEGTSPVGSFPPNGYGLYDMAGNVLEWCADVYLDYYYSHSPRENPIGSFVRGDIVNFVNNDFINTRANRVLRGGSYDYSPDSLRCADRYYGASHYASGFRCVQYP